MHILQRTHPKYRIYTISLYVSYHIHSSAYQFLKFLETQRPHIDQKSSDHILDLQ